VTRGWDIHRRQETGPAWGPQLFREVFAVKIAIWGVTFPPPQLGHATFAAARSATVSTTSKLFLQRSHMNVDVGIGFLPAGLPAFASRAKKVWIWPFLRTYRGFVISLRILARASRKDSMSFLIADPPLH
jgi:hypothetical protein